MSRTIDPRQQRETGRGFEPLPAQAETPADLRGAIRRAIDAHEAAKERGGLYAPSPLVMRPPSSEDVVLRSKGRGVLHRGWRTLDGELGCHPRCHALPAAEVLPSGAEFWSDNLSDSRFFCRYPWCFRAIVREMGIVPIVGHYSRRLPKRRAA